MAAALAVSAVSLSDSRPPQVKLADSGLIARKLAPFRPYVCASTDFLKRYPDLKEPADLANVPCITDTNSRSLNNWRFLNSDGVMQTITVKGPSLVKSPNQNRFPVGCRSSWSSWWMMAPKPSRPLNHQTRGKP